VVTSTKQLTIPSQTPKADNDSSPEKNVSGLSGENAKLSAVCLVNALNRLGKIEDEIRIELHSFVFLFLDMICHLTIFYLFLFLLFIYLFFFNFFRNAALKSFPPKYLEMSARIREAICVSASLYPQENPLAESLEALKEEIVTSIEAHLKNGKIPEEELKKKITAARDAVMKSLPQQNELCQFLLSVTQQIKKEAFYERFVLAENNGFIFYFLFFYFFIFLFFIFYFLFILFIFYFLFFIFIFYILFIALIRKKHPLIYLSLYSDG
jgi:hypothetical protein